MDEDRKQEWTLDARKIELEKIIKDNENEMAVYRAQVELPRVTRELRNFQYKTYGWRFCDRLYGEKDVMLEELDSLRRRILQLENEEIKFSNLIDNYDHDVERQKNKIQTLQGFLSSEIGFKPDPKAIEAANEKLIQIHHEVGLAQISLPKVQDELIKVNGDLENLESQWEKAKNFTADQVYESPGHEVHALTLTYMEDHENVLYRDASNHVLKTNPSLCLAYMGKQ
jgi:hypothetical protein